MRRSPTVETLAAIVLLFLGTQVVGILLPVLPALALTAPLTERPWTLVTSVYTHLTLGHLVGNAVVLAVVGPIVERRSTPTRFHAFVIATGALAGVVEVWVGGTLGTPAAVVGISGAVLALVGYVLASNLVTRGLLERVSPPRWLQAVAALGLAIGLTVLTAAPGVALAGHAIGLAAGLVAGRVRVLDARGRA